MVISDKAILVVSFGTSYNENRAKTIDAIEAELGKAYPDWNIKRAFTSKKIIKKLAERDNIYIDSVDIALERLINDGIKKVIVQPTVLMNGIEYESIVLAVNKFSRYFNELYFGKPLLNSEEDYEKVLSALESSQIKDAMSITNNQTAIILMGHGTAHYANSAYSQLYLKLKLSGKTNVFVTTVEGFPSFEDTLDLMKEYSFRNVVLFPFMIVAGDHANNDMASNEPESLRTLCEKEGYVVHSVLKGLGEYPEFRKIITDHVQDALDRHQ